MASTLPPESLPVTEAELGAVYRPRLESAPPSSTNRRSPHPTKRLLKTYEHFLIPALILFLVGNALALTLPSLAFAKLEIGLPLCVAFLGIALYAVGKPGQTWAIRLNLWLIALVAGSLHFHYRQFVPPTHDVSHLAPLERAEVMGTLLSQTGPHRGILDVSTLNGQKTSGHIQVSWPAEQRGEAVAAGTRLLISGALALPVESHIPGAFNQADYMRHQRISATLKKPWRVIAFETSNEPGFVLQRFTEQLKDRIAQAFTQQLPSPHGEILGGLVLGDKAIPVDKTIKQAFIQTGLVHLLAASGMNVGIIAGTVLWLLSLLKVVPYRGRIGLAMCAVAFYSLLTGLPPSIQRASAMLELALGLKLINRELSPVFLLCLASTLLVTLNPDCLGSIGFQFSILTTFGLLTMVPRLQEALGYYLTRGIAGLILVPLIAQLWVWPLSVAYFNQFPLHTVPLNIVALALVTPLTVLGFTAAVLSLIHPQASSLLCWLAKPFLDGLLALAQWGQAQGWAQWTLPSPSAWQIFGLYGLLFGLTLLIHGAQHWSQRRKTLAILLAVWGLTFFIWLQERQTQQLTRLALLPLSYKQEALVAQPAGTQAHVLLAPQTLNYFEARALADYLRHRHITRLDALILLPGRDDNRESHWLKAISTVRVDRLMASQPFNLPESIPARRVEPFPTAGGQLNLLNWQLTGQLTPQGTQLYMLAGRHCVLAIESQFNPASAKVCGLQLISQSSGGTRLIGPLPLPADRYYQLAMEGQRLRIDSH